MDLTEDLSEIDFPPEPNFHAENPSPPRQFITAKARVEKPRKFKKKKKKIKRNTVAGKNEIEEVKEEKSTRRSSKKKKKLLERE